MKFKIFVESIKKIIKNIPAIIRTISRLPHSGKYILLSFFLIIFFLIITFPYDYMIIKYMRDLEGRFYKSINIESIDFSIFKESYINDIEIILKNNNQFSCKKVIAYINLNPLKLYRNNIKINMQLDSANYKGEKYSTLFSVNGNIDIIVDKDTGLPFDGSVKLIFGKTLINLSEFKIPGPLGPMPVDIKNIEISNINIDSIISKGVMTIGHLQISGPDIRGSINGNFELKSIISNSKLNLTIQVNPESKILEQYKDFIMPMVKDNMLTIFLQGTVGDPDIKFSKDQN